MKKIYLCVLFGVLSFILLLGANPARASAVDNEFVVRVDYVTSNQVSDFNQALANLYGTNGYEAVVTGDYKVTVTLNNNTGYTDSALQVYYDKNNFRPVNKTGNAPDMNIVYGIAASGMTYLGGVNLNAGLVGLGAGYHNGDANSQSGVYGYFFLRPLTNATNLMNPVTRMAVVKYEEGYGISLNHTVNNHCRYKAFQYMLGDVNGDGVVDTLDSSALTNVINNHPGALIESNAGNAFAGLAGMYHNGILVFAVADVDYNEVVDQYDVNAILNYISCMNNGVPYNGDIGEKSWYYKTLTITTT